MELNVEGSDNGVERGVERGVENLSDKQKIILMLMKTEPKISKREIQIRSDLSKKAVDYNIDVLKRLGMIKRIGSDRGGIWKVNI